jgi:hypothetical protein
MFPDSAEIESIQPFCRLLFFEAGWMAVCIELLFSWVRLINPARDSHSISWGLHQTNNGYRQVEYVRSDRTHV